MATLSEYFYTGPRITLNSGRVINMQTIYLCWLGSYRGHAACLQEILDRNERCCPPATQVSSKKAIL